MEPVLSESLAAAYLRLEEAARADPEWFRDLVEAAGGQPLPYDPKLGISEAEYEEIMHGPSGIRVVRTAELTIEQVNEGQFALEATEPLESLNGVVFDTQQDVVRTPFGVTGRSTLIEASDRQRATGRWNGRSWKLEDLPPGQPLESVTGTVIEVNLGRLEAKPVGLLHYSVRAFLGGQVEERKTLLICFDLP